VKVFSREGYEKGNVNHIAKKAGFSIGTLYNHFPSKRKLMNELLEATAQTHIKFIKDRIIQAGEPGQRVNEFFQAGFDFVEQNIQIARIVFNTLNGPDEAFKEKLYKSYQPLFTLLAKEILMPGMATGEFRQLEPEATASLLMVIYLGAGSQFSPTGKHYFDPLDVANFVLSALRPG